MTMKILDYRRPPASYWRVPHDNFHYFIIFHYFGHILTHAKVYLLFVDAARAIIDFVQSTFCYNEGSGMFWCEVISSSKNNWVGHIVQMFLGIMTSRTARSYFKRFHWISSVVLMSYSSCTQVGFPHPSRVTVPCDTALKGCCRAVYCPWMDFINDRRTSPDGCKPIILDWSILQYISCISKNSCFYL